jgi:Na+/H+ antiporter NhaD/arsenite permease-like protein
MNIPLITTIVVLCLIIVRRIAGVHIAIWQAMCGGALVVLATGNIAPLRAWQAIDWDVMFFLTGMFVVGHALVASGYLRHAAYRTLARAHSTDQLVLLILLVGGAAAALLMNDTLAIIATPLMVQLARQHRLDPKLLLLSLAFGITLGSVPSPIGNPQNLLIAAGAEMQAPFATFMNSLGVPTLINLSVAYAVLRLAFYREFRRPLAPPAPPPPYDEALTRIVRVSLLLIIGMIVLKVLLATVASDTSIRLSAIAVAGCTPLLLFSRRRRELWRGIDWRTLGFFVALFVLMTSVWDSGVFQSIVGEESGGTIQLQPSTILGTSIVVSQLISNVPLVALYLPLLTQAHADVSALLTLAAGSTIAGNLTVLGAASNVIIVQLAERDGVHLSYLDFARVGLLLTALNALIYYAYLS